MTGANTRTAALGIGCVAAGAVAAGVLTLGVAVGVALHASGPWTPSANVVAEVPVPIEVAAPAEPDPEPVAGDTGPTEDPGEGQADAASGGEAEAPAAAAPRPRARRQPPAPPEPSQPEIKIITDPPAVPISVDGSDAGPTPAKLSLEPGSHKITLTAEKGSSTFVITVDGSRDRWCYKVSKRKATESGC